MLALKIISKSTVSTKKFGRNYCTENSTETNSTPEIIDKKKSMNQIRIAIANSIKPIDPKNIKRKFIEKNP